MANNQKSALPFLRSSAIHAAWFHHFDCCFLITSTTVVSHLQKTISNMLYKFWRKCWFHMYLHTFYDLEDFFKRIVQQKNIGAYMIYPFIFIFCISTFLLKVNRLGENQKLLKNKWTNWKNFTPMQTGFNSVRTDFNGVLTGFISLHNNCRLSNNTCGWSWPKRGWSPFIWSLYF